MLAGTDEPPGADVGGDFALDDVGAEGIERWTARCRSGGIEQKGEAGIPKHAAASRSGTVDVPAGHPGGICQRTIIAAKQRPG